MYDDKRMVDGLVPPELRFEIRYPNGYRLSEESPGTRILFPDISDGKMPELFVPQGALEHMFIAAMREWPGQIYSVRQAGMQKEEDSLCGIIVADSVADERTSVLKFPQHKLGLKIVYLSKGHGSSNNRLAGYGINVLTEPVFSIAEKNRIRWGMSSVEITRLWAEDSLGLAMEASRGEGSRIQQCGRLLLDMTNADLRTKQSGPRDIC